MADGRVIIDTELNTKGAEKSASSLGGKLKSGLSGGLKTGAKVATSAITAVGASAIATGGALVKMAKSTAEAGDHIDKMSQKMGMSAEAYQKWDYVAKISGTSIDRLKMGFKTLTNTIDSATKGNDKAIAKFQAVGVSMDDLKNKSREQIFEDTIKGLQNVTNETERSALANQLLGRAGMELGPILNSTNGDLEKLMKTAEDYGMIMSDKAVKASAKFQDSVTTMQQTMTGLKNRMMAEFLPAMTEVTDGLALIFKGDTDAGLEKIDSGISGIVDKVTSALPKLLKIGGSIIESIGSAIIENLPKLLNTGVEIIVGLIQGILSAIPKIAEAIPQIITSIIGALQNGIPMLIEALPTVINALVNGFFDSLGAFYDNAPQLIDLAVKVVLGLADALLQALPLFINRLPELIQKMVDYIVSSLPILINGVIQLVMGIVKALPTIIISLVRALPQIIKSVVTGLIKALPMLIKGVIQLVIMLVENLPTIIMALIEAIPDIIIGVVDALIDALPLLIKGNITLIVELVKAMPRIIKALIEAIPKIVISIVNAFKKLGGKYMDIGLNMIKGIWNGIKNAGKWLMDKIKGFFGGVVDGIKDFLGIHSPSRLMADQVGKWMALGVYEGFNKNNPMNQINKDLKTGIGAIETSINLNNALNYQRIGEAVSDGIANSNLGISLDGRQFGRVVRSV